MTVRFRSDAIVQRALGDIQLAEGNTGNASGGGGNMGLAFIVGGLLVVVVIIAFFVFGRGGMPDATKDIDVDVNLPKVEAPSVPTPPKA